MASQMAMLFLQSGIVTAFFGAAFVYALFDGNWAELFSLGQSSLFRRTIVGVGLRTNAVAGVDEESELSLVASARLPYDDFDTSAAVPTRSSYTWGISYSEGGDYKYGEELVSEGHGDYDRDRPRVATITGAELLLAAASVSTHENESAAAITDASFLLSLSSTHATRLSTSPSKGVSPVPESSTVTPFQPASSDSIEDAMLLLGLSETSDNSESLISDQVSEDDAQLLLALSRPLSSLPSPPPSSSTFPSSSSRSINFANTSNNQYDDHGDQEVVTEGYRVETDEEDAEGQFDPQQVLHNCRERLRRYLPVRLVGEVYCGHRYNGTPNKEIKDKKRDLTKASKRKKRDPLGRGRLLFVSEWKNEKLSEILPVDVIDVCEKGLVR